MRISPNWNFVWKYWLLCFPSPKRISKEIFQPHIAAALQRKQNTCLCLLCGLAGEIRRDRGSCSKAFVLSRLKKVKWKWQGTFTVSQPVSFELCVASAATVFLRSPWQCLLQVWVLLPSEFKTCQVVSWQIMFCCYFNIRHLFIGQFICLPEKTVRKPIYLLLYCICLGILHISW